MEPQVAPMLSIIVPVYNRPEELDELLASLVAQAYYDYELIIVEDGSSRPSAHIIDKYRTALPSVEYVATPNGGPSRARNIGARYARGEYLIILDSDVVLPAGYLSAVDQQLATSQADAFGGPDAAAPDFSPMQHAVSYAMTSIFTTGGIRGGRANTMEQFKPRTYNMGVRRSLFHELGGFNETMRYGEDIDFSLRLIERGAKVCLFPEAFVYHKRRIDLAKFFWQVHHSGEARIELERRHPGSTRMVHYLPACFTVVSVLAILSVVGMLPFVVYALVLFFDAWRQTGLLEAAVWAVPASFIQLWGYGTGFIKAWIRSRN